MSKVRFLLVLLAVIIVSAQTARAEKYFFSGNIAVTNLSSDVGSVGMECAVCKDKTPCPFTGEAMAIGRTEAKNFSRASGGGGGQSRDASSGANQAREFSGPVQVNISTDKPGANRYTCRLTLNLKPASASAEAPYARPDPTAADNLLLVNGALPNPK